MYVCISFHTRGADLNARNAAGNTPLMTAILFGNAEALLLILQTISKKHNMSIKQILSASAKGNESILTWAVQMNHTVLIEVLIQLP